MNIAKIAAQLRDAITNPRAQARTATTQTFQVDIPPNPDFQPPASTLLPRPRPAPALKVQAELAWQIVAEPIAGGLSTGEHNKCLELQCQWDKMHRDANYNFTSQQAKVDFIALDREQWARFYESGEELKNFKAVGLDHLLLDYSVKMALARKTLLEVEQQSLRFCSPIRERFLKSASKHLAKLEEVERTESEQFGIAWQPSARVTVLRGLVARLRHGHENPRPGSPRALLPFVQF